MQNLLDIVLVGVVVLGALAYLGLLAYRRIVKRRGACGGCGGGGKSEPPKGVALTVEGRKTTRADGGEGGAVTG